MNRILLSPFARATGRGFTLIEVIVSLFIFLIIMLALSSTFAQSFIGYRNTRAVQKDVENAQFALNLMAKELRTSTIVSPAGSPLSVKFYDYSQKMCFEYKISSKQLTVAKRTINNPTDNPFSDCSGTIPGAMPLVKIENTGGDLTGVFKTTPSSVSPKQVGKITVSLHISEGPKNQANVQTTSSLRDYGYVGLIGD